MTLAAAMRRRDTKLWTLPIARVAARTIVDREPLKIAGLAFAGFGHWFGGACIIAGGYGAGLLLVDRLFRVVKSKLYTMEWCASLASWSTLAK
jgi:hypothetical protein